LEHDQHPASSVPQPDPRRESDEALLADLTSPPPLEQARESYDYWRQRAAELPVHKRAERKEAQAMSQQWKQRVAEAERARYGPTLLDQLLTALGVRRPPHLPSRRKIIFGLSVAAFLVVTILILLIVAVIAFWPHIEPIIRDLTGGNRGGG
jgi:hypothetical protein